MIRHVLQTADQLRKQLWPCEDCGPQVGRDLSAKRQHHVCVLFQFSRQQAQHLFAGRRDLVTFEARQVWRRHTTALRQLPERKGRIGPRLRLAQAAQMGAETLISLFHVAYICNVHSLLARLESFGPKGRSRDQRTPKGYAHSWSIFVPVNGAGSRVRSFGGVAGQVIGKADWADLVNRTINGASSIRRPHTGERRFSQAWEKCPVDFPAHVLTPLSAPGAQSSNLVASEDEGTPQVWGPHKSGDHGGGGA